MARGGRWARGAVGLAVLLAVAEALSRAGLVSSRYLPPASTVLARAAQLVGDAAFRSDLAATLVAWWAGLTLAVVGGIVLGVVLGSVPALNAAVTAVVEFLRPIPSVALIPLISLILGTGLGTELTLTCYAAVWPVLFNTIYGLRDVDVVARDTLRCFGFGRMSVLWRVSLPHAAPFIAAGVRLAASIALILAVATEILSGFGTGLGTFIAQAQQSVAGITDALAGMVWAGALGLAANGALRFAEHHLFAWHHARSGWVS